MWEIYQWECRPLLWHQERWCVKCDLQRGINQLCGHKSTGMGFSWVSLPERNGEKTTASCENGCVRWSACSTERMVKFVFFEATRGGECPPLLSYSGWITYPIFSAPAAHRPLLGPRQWSHVGGWEEGGEDRTGEDRRGEEKDPLLLLHIQKEEEKKKRETTGSISINHNAPAVFSSQSGGDLFQTHVETAYIPIPSPGERPPLQPPRRQRKEKKKKKRIK